MQLQLVLFAAFIKYALDRNDMRVLLAHNNFSVIGGAEVFYHQVGRILESRGHEVAYFSGAEEKVPSTWGAYFPKVASYNSGPLLKRVLSFPKMVYSIEAKTKAASLISDFKPDIIHAFALYVRLTPSILDAAADAGVPVVMSCNDYKHICPNYKLFHHGRICEECKNGNFYRAIFNRCSHDSVIYSTASAVEAYVHDALGVYKRNVHTYLFASEFMARKTEEFWGADSFRWRKLRNPFNSSSYAPVHAPFGPVLYFGRLIEEKGVATLVNAASMVPDVDIRIVGDGPDLSSLRELAASSGANNVVFVGAKWGNEMDEEIRNCRFVVIPSLWHENFPYVINQSFAFGKAVVGANRGGIPELVSHGERGLVYDASDPAALAAAIQDLWQTPERVREMGESAKQFSDLEYSEGLFYENIKSIYDEVLECEL